MTVRLVDLSHEVEHGMITYKGLPADLAELPLESLAHLDAVVIRPEGKRAIEPRVSSGSIPTISMTSKI